MKKLGFLALALCAAGAASALTTDWKYNWGNDAQIGTNASGTPTVNSMRATIDAPYVSSVGNAIYYGAIVTGKGPGSNAHRVVFGIGDGTKGGQSISVNIGQDGKLYLYQNGAGKEADGGVTGSQIGATTNAVLAASSASSTTAYLVLAIDRTGETATVTLYASDVNGTYGKALITASNVTITGDLDTVYAVDYYGTGGGSLWGVGESVKVYANLPEPTALALLALGVAGVALRRRVA